MRITKTHIIWNYIGAILNHGISIFILPLVLQFLTSSELGMWYVFGSIAALASLVDFGFSPTIMRNITYTFGGAKRLLAEGVEKCERGDEPNFELLSALLGASKKIYLGLAIFSGLILSSVGTLYINSLVAETVQDYMLAWIINVLAVTINMYYSFWAPVLKGVGGVKEANQSILYSRVVYLVIAVVGLIIGRGLVGLSLANLISGLLMRVLSKIYFHRIVGRRKLVKNSKISIRPILNIIWPNAKKSGVVTVGAWLITRSTTLLCSSFLGLEVTSQYGLSLQLLSFVFTFSTLLFNSYVPELAYLHIENNNDRYHMILSRSMVVQWTVGIFGAVFIIVGGDLVLELFNSNSSLLPLKSLILLSLVLFLEQNHSTFATAITLGNQVPFVKSALISGTAIVLFGFIVLKFTAFGILGLIVVQGIVQLAYNNWYWPRMVMRSTGLSPLRMLRYFIKKD